MLHAGLYFLNASATTWIVPAEANMPLFHQPESRMGRHVGLESGRGLEVRIKRWITSLDYINTDILSASVDAFLHKL
jgi:hypothetical protein